MLALILRHLGHFSAILWWPSQLDTKKQSVSGKYKSNTHAYRANVVPKNIASDAGEGLNGQLRSLDKGVKK